MPGHMKMGRVKNLSERNKPFDRTNIRYRGINFVIIMYEELADYDKPDGNKQFWAQLEWPRGHLAARLENAGKLVGVPSYRFEFFTCYTCRGAHRSYGDVFDEAANYIKDTIDVIYDVSVEQARMNANKAETIINEIKEELTQRGWMTGY